MKTYNELWSDLNNLQKKLNNTSVDESMYETVCDLKNSVLLLIEILNKSDLNGLPYGP